MFSIVDPATFRGGAGTATRGLLDLLRAEPLSAEVEVLHSAPSIGRRGHAARRVISVLRSFLSPLPSKAIFQRARGFPARVRERLARNDYDLVLINGCDLLWVRDFLRADVPVVVCVHNIEQDLYAAQIERLPAAGLLRPLLRRDLAKLRRFEDQGLHDADGTVFLSLLDAKAMLARLGRRAPLVLPPVFGGEPWARRQRRRGDPMDVGFLANFDWWPNLDGLQWFLDEVLPGCRGRIRLHLFGNASDRFRGAAPGVYAHGYVSDTSTVWDTCDVMICPIRTGGGVNVKLAEAIFHGMPVLATPYAARGLPVKPGPALAVAETAAEWSSFIAGEGLADLASAAVAKNDSDLFRADTHADRLAVYLRELL